LGGQFGREISLSQKKKTKQRGGGREEKKRRYSKRTRERQIPPQASVKTKGGRGAKKSLELTGGRSKGPPAGEKSDYPNRWSKGGPGGRKESIWKR